MADHKQPSMREARYWQKVTCLGQDECWPWVGYLNAKGYGQFRDGDKMRPSTHIALELAGYPRPAAPMNHALHSDSCTTRACCNPRHLRWGSNAENVADRERLGRNKVPHVYGERQGRAVLTEDKVKAIRQAAGSQKRIAAEFECSQMTVSLVKRRVTWRHVV